MGIMDIIARKKDKMTGIVSDASNRLDRILQGGSAQVGKAMASIYSEFDMRKDYIVKPEAMKFHVGPEDRIIMNYNGDDHVLTSHAEQQLYSKVGVPANFGQNLIKNKLQDLLVTNLTELNHKVNDKGILIREVGNAVKGILSPSFRRMSSAPIFEAFVEEAIGKGYAPHKGYNTDYRYRLDFIMPKLIELFRGEYIATGLSIMTGDYGSSKLQIEMNILRIWCDNMATGYSLMSKVHLGKRFEAMDDISHLSKATHELDDKTLASAVKDIVSGSGDQIDTFVNFVQTKGEGIPNFEAYLGSFKKKFGKELAEKVKGMWISDDMPIELLPKENNNWRMSNIVSLLAKGQKSQDLRIDLEQEALASLN